MSKYYGYVSRPGWWAAALRASGRGLRWVSVWLRSLAWRIECRGYEEANDGHFSYRVTWVNSDGEPSSPSAGPGESRDE